MPSRRETSHRRTCLQVLPALVTGGVERGAVDMAIAQAAAGWRALVVSAGGGMVRELARAGAEHMTLPLDTKNPVAIRRNANLLAELIRREQVDLVHARSRAPGWSAHWAAQTTNVPFITTFHGVYSLGLFGLKKRYNHVMTRGARVIAISAYIRDHMIREYGVEPERIRVIHRGVDTATLDPNRVSPKRLIQVTSRWRLPDDGRVVMLPGRLTSWKGHMLLIDALAELKRRDTTNTKIRCLMIGQDQGRSAYRAAILAHAARRGVDGQVQIIDDCNDLPAAYMATDVVVSASTRPEAFGRVVAEAQSMGRPVVAPDHGAAPEIIAPGITGWLFTPGDVISLANALTTALALDQDSRIRLADAAINRARALFDKADMCAKTLAVYDELVPVPAESP
ncbi:MAG: glycosyltransferase [Rhodospirillaceae bacterium]|nr:MAG: glycosyltransferase [Rhodospirillaceae bacterium]